jgi:hypothetical protein
VLSLGVLPGAAGLGVLALVGGAGWLLVRLAQGEPGLWPGVVALLGVPGAVWWGYLWG